jgi:hypothetical protein
MYDNFFAKTSIPLGKKNPQIFRRIFLENFINHNIGPGQGDQMRL